MNFFDLHCDTATEMYKKRVPFCGKNTAVSAESASVFEAWKQCFAVWLRDDESEPYEYYKAVLRDLRSKLQSCPQNLTPVFTVEGGALIENELSRIKELYSDGVRAMSLTWNGKSLLAAGAECSGGLTQLGKSAVKLMNELGIACDVSHLNKESFWDVIELAEQPLATHSCCSAVFEHNRNLDNAQLKAISERGGIIGICCYPPFLGGDVYNGILKNIRHMLRLGLENSIAFGTDFDGGSMASQLDSTEKIPRLREFLLNNGLSEELLEKIFYSNANKFFI